MKRKITPPAYFAIFLILSIVSNFFLPLVKFIFYPYTLISIPLIIIGITLNVWPIRIFLNQWNEYENKHKKSHIESDEPLDTLNISGPFKFSRNPMYFGMLIILLGIAIFFGSLISFIFPILFMIIINALFIVPEEKNLEKKFQKDYVDYKKRVRKWI